jgi:hypothetical protein
MKGSFTVGTVTAVEARLSLPTWNGAQLTSAGTSVIPSLQLSGDMIYSTSSAVVFRHATLIEPSVSYMTFAYQSSTNAAFQKILGTVMSANNQNFSFSSRIPISDWQQSNIIIGQFNGLESCASTLDCTDTFSAKISSAGVISGENVNWLNGSCTVATSSFTCPINSGIFTQEPNCTITVDSSANGVAIKSSGASSSQLAYQTTSGAGGSNTPYAVEVICQKQGADYIGKTAKAVASDQNLRTLGVTKQVLTRFDFGGATSTTACSASPCTIYNTKGGNFITSMTRAALGDYSITLNPAYWNDVTDVRCWTTAPFAVWNQVIRPSISGVFSYSTRTNLGTSYVGLDLYGTMYCEGVTP